MKVQVTNEHIKKGIPCESSSCPVALAVKELFPGKDVAVQSFPFNVKVIGVQIDGKSIDITEDQLEVNRFVRLFDHWGYVEPFEFELNV